MRKQVTLEDILREEGAQQAWDQLIGLGVPSNSLEFSLVALANKNLPIYPPRLSPKEVRGFARRLREDAEKIAQILRLEPFLEGLTNAGARLPALLKGFADEIGRLKFFLPKRRHKPEVWGEIGIVNDVVWATGYDPATKGLAPQKIKHSFEAAADLINAAYAASDQSRIVSANSLAKSWYRYSHMRDRPRPGSSSR